MVEMEVFGESQSSWVKEDTEHTTNYLKMGTNNSFREGQTSPYKNWNGNKRWPVLIMSMIGSALALFAVGSLCALLYPVLKELRAERVRGDDGTDVRVLGFWSVLLLSLIAGCICCAFSWTLTYLDSYKPGMAFPNPLILPLLKHVPVQTFHLGYSVAVLNGIMATLAVIWNLV